MVTIEDMKLIIDGLLALKEVEVRNSESQDGCKKVEALLQLHKIDDLLFRLKYKEVSNGKPNNIR